MNGLYTVWQIESVNLIEYVLVVRVFHPPNGSNAVNDFTPSIFTVHSPPNIAAWGHSVVFPNSFFHISIVAYIPTYLPNFLRAVIRSVKYLQFSATVYWDQDLQSTLYWSVKYIQMREYRSGDIWSLMDLAWILTSVDRQFPI